MTHYRLIVLDLDHTLLNEENKLSPANLNCLKHCMDQGLAVTFATGRTFSSALPFAKQAGLKMPMINCQGAAVTQMDGTVIRQKCLANPLARQILDKLLPMPVNLIYCHEDTVYARHHDLSRHQERRSHHLPMPADMGDITPLKIGASGTEEAIHAAYQLISCQFGQTVHVAKSSPHFLEITDASATKSAAIAFLAQQLNIQREAIIAFGDSMNDLDMLSYAGTGVAMGNAINELKAIATYVAESNDNDGVAKMLHRLLSHEEDLP